MSETLAAVMIMSCVGAFAFGAFIAVIMMYLIKTDKKGF